MFLSICYTKILFGDVNKNVINMSTMTIVVK